MKDVQVYGRFVNELGLPISGTCEFIPSKLWVEEGEHTFPVPSPLVELEEGRVNVQLARTDDHDFFYKVICPIGSFVIRVEANGPLLLKELMSQYA